MNEKEKEIKSLKEIVEMKKYIISETQKSENQLHKEASIVLSNLKSCLKDMLMATGDNPYTSISVALESELIDNNKKIFICDFDKFRGINYLKV